METHAQNATIFNIFGYAWHILLILLIVTCLVTLLPHSASVKCLISLNNIDYIRKILNLWRVELTKTWEKFIKFNPIITRWNGNALKIVRKETNLKFILYSFAVICVPLDLSQDQLDIILKCKSRNTSFSKKEKMISLISLCDWVSHIYGLIQSLNILSTLY